MTTNCFIPLFTTFLLFYKPISADSLNVVLLAYRRSGSSYVGEVLSSHEEISYFFEPLTYTQMVISRSDSSAKLSTMKGLFRCDGDLLKYLSLRIDGVWVVRKLGNVSDEFLDPILWSKDKLRDLCLNSSVIVAKTIRLRLADVYQLLMENRLPNLRIIHLVRDPRGRYLSTISQGGNWNFDEKSLDNICGEMEEDLKFWEQNKQNLNQSVYYRLRYEDLVSNPREKSKEIFSQFYGLSWDSSAIDKYIEEHNEAEKGPQNRVLGYYATYRKSTFDPSAWKHKLTQQQLDLINSKCIYVIQQLQYK
ncbi:hypothetical protein CHUAL_001174 [Chamberlinius hualienensis]